MFGRRRRAKEPSPPDIDGLVLGGGGARASFQIGALRYLYDVVGIGPQAIAATSAGSIVGAVLAQSSRPDEQARALACLDGIWMGMQEQADMFTPRSWFALLQRKASALKARLGHRGATNRPGRHGAMTASRLAALLRAAPGLVLDVGSVRAILNGAGTTLSAYRVGPFLEKVLDPSWFHSYAIATSGVRLRVAMVSLESGRLRYMTEQGRLVDREDRPLNGGTYDVTRGVLASSSIPGALRPVELDGQHYVDGGTRENVPVEIATRHLGVCHPCVITCSPQRQSTDASGRVDTLTGSVSRAIGLMTNQISADELAYARRVGARIISPDVDVHDSMTIDPGLLQINRDYGWMSAAEAITGAGQAERGLVNRVVRLRMRSWELEKSWLGGLAEHRRKVDHRLTEALRQVKDALRDAVSRLPDALRPAGADQWGLRLEAHSHMRPGLTPPWLVPLAAR